jgi:hypothetical protein
MKYKIILTLALSLIINICSGQQSSAWDKWNWLIGDWEGEGSGQPGSGGGTFSFSLDLDSKVLIRKSHSEYPSAEGKSTLVHEDLMIVYLDFSGSPNKAIYFDNEGHIINYTISYSDKEIILTSDKVPNSPVFRLVYSLLDTETINTRFEFSQDGENFSPYIEGKSKKN